jgi:hypothetical protein
VEFFSDKIVVDCDLPPFLDCRSLVDCGREQRREFVLEVRILEQIHERQSDVLFPLHPFQSFHASVENVTRDCEESLALCDIPSPHEEWCCLVCADFPSTDSDENSFSPLECCDEEADQFVPIASLSSVMSRLITAGLLTIAGIHSSQERLSRPRQPSLASGVRP